MPSRNDTGTPSRPIRRPWTSTATNGDVWNELGTIHLKSEAFDEAAEAFTKAIELDRGNGWAYSNLAYAYMQQGKHKEGVSLLLRSIELLESDADKAVSWNRLASLYRALNDYDNAVAAYQMADKLTTGVKTPSGGARRREAEAARRTQQRQSASRSRGRRRIPASGCRGGAGCSR